jgi:hypothetical protein
MSLPAEHPLPTLDSWIKVVAPYLAPSLAGAPAKDRLERTARCLPADALGIIEVRLAAEEPEVDLSLRLKRPEQALRLAQIAERLDRPHLQEFLARWAAEGRAQIPSLWLEFDLDRDAEDLPTPLLCAELHPEIDPLWLTDALLPSLHGRPLAPAQRERVLECARAVPPPARLLYAFSLLSRPQEAVRLEILGLDPVAVEAYLERVAPHAVGTAAAIAPLLAGTEKPHLSLDISGVGGAGAAAGEVLPRIGLEGAFARQPRREQRWAEILGRLVDRGLCLPAKRDAVLAWPGYDSFWTAPGRWPRETGGLSVRFLSHLKVVGWPDRPPQAKVYLGLRHLP